MLSTSASLSQERKPPLFFFITLSQSKHNFQNKSEAISFLSARWNPNNSRRYTGERRHEEGRIKRKDEYRKLRRNDTNCWKNGGHLHSSSFRQCFFCYSSWNSQSCTDSVFVWTWSAHVKPLHIMVMVPCSMWTWWVYWVLLRQMEQRRGEHAISNLPWCFGDLTGSCQVPASPEHVVNVHPCLFDTSLKCRVCESCINTTGRVEKWCTYKSKTR